MIFYAVEQGIRLGTKHYNYREITNHCTQQIEFLVADARRHAGAERQYRIERAYGVYMGWRSLVMEHADPREFLADDRQLEQLIFQAKPAFLLP